MIPSFLRKQVVLVVGAVGLVSAAVAAVAFAAPPEDDRPPLAGPDAAPPPDPAADDPGGPSNQPGPRRPRGPKGPQGQGHRPKDAPPDQADPGIIPPDLDLFDEPDTPFFDRPPEIDRARLREFMEEHFPDETNDLRTLERTDRNLFRRRMREIAPRMIRLMREMEQDETLGLLGIEEERLELRIRRGLRDYLIRSEPAEREQVRGRIAALLAQQFDVRQKRNARHIEKLAERLEQLKSQLEQRNQRRDEIIAHELELRLTPPAPGTDQPPRGPRSNRRPGPPAGDAQ